MRNDEFVKPGGPIFIYVGGEWTISPGWIRGGHMYNMAKEFDGQLFYTEHRYYGESHPTSYDIAFRKYRVSALTVFFIPVIYNI